MEGLVNWFRDEEEIEDRRGGMFLVYYYHGSPYDMDVIEPKPSELLNNEKVVFATDKKWMAILFAAQWDDKDFEVGSFDGENWYLMEQRENAIMEKLLNKRGYVYAVVAEQFVEDERVGMPGSEFICRKPVEVQFRWKYDSLYKALMQESENVTLITWEQKRDFILDSMRRYRLRAPLTS